MYCNSECYVTLPIHVEYFCNTFVCSSLWFFSFCYILIFVNIIFSTSFLNSSFSELIVEQTLSLAHSTILLQMLLDVILILWQTFLVHYLALVVFFTYLCALIPRIYLKLILLWRVCALLLTIICFFELVVKQFFRKELFLKDSHATTFSWINVSVFWKTVYF